LELKCHMQKVIPNGNPNSNPNGVLHYGLEFYLLDLRFGILLFGIQISNAKGKFQTVIPNGVLHYDLDFTFWNYGLEFYLM